MAGETGAAASKGRLFIVATPVGNLEDVTLRALRILGEVEAVACEDTRQTLKLLNKYQLRKRLISYYHPHEGRKIPEIIGLLMSGRDVALVSDAGTPGISDPGFPLIREALKEGIQVVPVPGPSAVAAALSASGLPTHRFLFAGFPHQRREGSASCSNLSTRKRPLSFFISPRGGSSNFLRPLWRLWETGGL